MTQAMYLICQFFKAYWTIQTFFWYIIKSNSDGWVLLFQKGICIKFNNYKNVEHYLNISETPLYLYPVNNTLPEGRRTQIRFVWFQNHNIMSSKLKKKKKNIRIVRQENSQKQQRGKIVNSNNKYIIQDAAIRHNAIELSTHIRGLSFLHSA